MWEKFYLMSILLPVITVQVYDNNSETCNWSHTLGKYGECSVYFQKLLRSLFYLVFVCLFWLVGFFFFFLRKKLSITISHKNVDFLLSTYSPALGLNICSQATSFLLHTVNLSVSFLYSVWISSFPRSMDTASLTTLPPPPPPPPLLPPPQTLAPFLPPLISCSSKRKWIWS